ncbi:hypothetical protein FNV43_RR00477 [Rhamnella rubrinervis]|uniref:Uncharacterized protein n=1 Tax=Rhamnella rubrinervis TaxID=2594499 RepID=A0A8K0HQF8_9ROSA|nr:hypothetical protein FNV43_RR00477 [Rhamnella rubrinervis]
MIIKDSLDVIFNHLGCTSKLEYVPTLDEVILFVTVFDSLNRDWEKELEAVGRQFPFEPLKTFVICAVPVKYSEAYILRRYSNAQERIESKIRLLQYKLCSFRKSETEKDAGHEVDNWKYFQLLYF